MEIILPAVTSQSAHTVTHLYVEMHACTLYVQFHIRFLPPGDWSMEEQLDESAKFAAFRFGHYNALSTDLVLNQLTLLTGRLVNKPIESESAPWLFRVAQQQGAVTAFAEEVSAIEGRFVYRHERTQSNSNASSEIPPRVFSCFRFFLACSDTLLFFSYCYFLYRCLSREFLLRNVTYKTQ